MRWRLRPTPPTLRKWELRARVAEAYYDAKVYPGKVSLRDGKTNEIRWIDANIPVWPDAGVKRELQRMKAKDH